MGDGGALVLGRPAVAVAVAVAVVVVGAAAEVGVVAGKTFFFFRYKEEPFQASLKDDVGIAASATENDD